MSRPRSFDWDEAQRLRAAGLTYVEIGRRLGVSANSVACACDPAFRARQRAASRRLHDLYREPCRGGCGVLVRYRGQSATTGYCIDCWRDRIRFEAEMRDNHGTETRYVSIGCRCAACTAAATEAKRRRRERSRVLCSHGCGRSVVSINRPDPDKPFECLPCANARIRAERKGAAA